MVGRLYDSSKRDIVEGSDRAFSVEEWSKEMIGRTSSNMGALGV